MESIKKLWEESVYRAIQRNGKKEESMKGNLILVGHGLGWSSCHLLCSANRGHKRGTARLMERKGIFLPVFFFFFWACQGNPNNVSSVVGSHLLLDEQQNHFFRPHYTFLQMTGAKVHRHSLFMSKLSNSNLFFLLHPAVISCLVPEYSSFAFPILQYLVNQYIKSVKITDMVAVSWKYPD